MTRMEQNTKPLAALDVAGTGDRRGVDMDKPHITPEDCTLVGSLSRAMNIDAAEEIACVVVVTTSRTLGDRQSISDFEENALRNMLGKYGLEKLASRAVLVFSGPGKPPTDSPYEERQKSLLDDLRAVVLQGTGKSRNARTKPAKAVKALWFEVKKLLESGRVFLFDGSKESVSAIRETVDDSRSTDRSMAKTILTEEIAFGQQTRALTDALEACSRLYCNVKEAQAVDEAAGMSEGEDHLSLYTNIIEEEKEKLHEMEDVNGETKAMRMEEVESLQKKLTKDKKDVEAIKKKSQQQRETRDKLTREIAALESKARKKGSRAFVSTNFFEGYSKGARSPIPEERVLRLVPIDDVLEDMPAGPVDADAGAPGQGGRHRNGKNDGSDWEGEETDAEDGQNSRDNIDDADALILGEVARAPAAGFTWEDQTASDDKGLEHEKEIGAFKGQRRLVIEFPTEEVELCPARSFSPALTVKTRRIMFAEDEMPVEEEDDEEQPQKKFPLLHVTIGKNKSVELESYDEVGGKGRLIFRIFFKTTKNAKPTLTARLRQEVTDLILPKLTKLRDARDRLATKVEDDQNLLEEKIAAIDKLQSTIDEVKMKLDNKKASAESVEEAREKIKQATKQRDFVKGMVQKLAQYKSDK
ncbi:unnamed protein product [Amoebophrya sp. A120]|nr:unnamed protein product [Amoebophrya sp. A120]|eukprot:GSA120T00015069001.1